MSPEHVSRQDDERLYQPRIHSRHIRELHRLSLETGEPITVLVDQALTEFVARYRVHNSPELSAAPLGSSPEAL